MADAPKLKDYFTAEVVRSIGDRLAVHHGVIVVDDFVGRVLAPDGGEPFVELAFTARSRRIAEAIVESASLDPPELFDLLVRSLPPELGTSEGVLNDGFSLWPYGDVIARFGAEHPTEALAACYELTKRFTSEFAIRPVLAAHPDAMDTLVTWCDDPNEHVRRLVSEGSRPRLPWAQRLALPIDEVLGLLSALRADPSPYVRKSVANHLNDLGKDHPDRIIDLLAGWYKRAEVDGVAETQWIVRHALRNHLKDGTPGALAIFGYEPPQIDVVDLSCSPDSVAIGQSVEVSFELAPKPKAPASQLLMVDLVMGYAKANGSISPKVFKFRELTIGDAQEHCTKTFDMMVRSTRKLYSGRHTLAVRVNGVDLAETEFELT